MVVKRLPVHFNREPFTNNVKLSLLVDDYDFSMIEEIIEKTDECHSFG